MSPFCRKQGQMFTTTECMNRKGFFSSEKKRPECEGCLMVPDPEPKPGDAPAGEKPEGAAQISGATCVCCGKPGKIFARGLIVACYFRHTKAGTLDNYQAKRRRA